MPGVYLFGFSEVDGAKTKVLCTAEGKIIIDPTLILEDDPTENESTKAPTSKWAFAHKALSSAHHTKFTAANARAAINDQFSSTGLMLRSLYCNFKTLRDVLSIMLTTSGAQNVRIYIDQKAGEPAFQVRAWDSVLGYIGVDFTIYNGTVYEKVATEPYVDSKVAIFKGTHWWSCPGIHFDAFSPDIDNVAKESDGTIRSSADGIFFICAVNLPNGATVTGAILYGNAGAEGETWTLERVHLAAAATGLMAGANIGTEDTSIDAATVDNSAYAYFLKTTSLDTNDIIYGARITYTL